MLVRGGRREERLATERCRCQRCVLLAHALEVVEQQKGVAEVDLHALDVDRDEREAGLVEELAAVREARGGRAPGANWRPLCDQPGRPSIAPYAAIPCSATPSRCSSTLWSLWVRC